MTHVREVQRCWKWMSHTICHTQTPRVSQSSLFLFLPFKPRRTKEGRCVNLSWLLTYHCEVWRLRNLIRCPVNKASLSAPPTPSHSFVCGYDTANTTQSRVYVDSVKTIILNGQTVILQRAERMHTKSLQCHVVDNIETPERRRITAILSLRQPSIFKTPRYLEAMER